MRLRDARGGTNPGFHDVYEWDPVSGPGAIDNFRRLPVRGEWTLKVWDRVPERVGSLVYFNIYVVAAQCFNNAACDDNNLCTIDACLHPNEGGTCAHQAKQCEPSDNPCMANVCEPTTGVCGPKTAADGAPCDDGLFCTEDDFCRAGACTAGDAKVCTHLDGNCTVGECSEDLDQCIVVPAADGASCNDGEPCNAGDFCGRRASQARRSYAARAAELHALTTATSATAWTGFAMLTRCTNLPTTSNARNSASVPQQSAVVRRLQDAQRTELCSCEDGLAQRGGLLPVGRMHGRRRALTARHSTRTAR